MTRQQQQQQQQYRNKYVISPENAEGTFDDSNHDDTINNYEIIHVLQYNSSNEDVPFDVEAGRMRTSGDSMMMMIPQRKNQSHQSPPLSSSLDDDDDDQPDPPGLLAAPTTVSVPDDSKTTKNANSESENIDKKEETNAEDFTATFLEKEDDIQFFAHSRLWTSLAILCAWTGFTLALLARNSTKFVSIKIPMYFDPNYNTVTNLGMVHLELCFNSTYIPGYEGCIIDKLGSEEVSDLKYQLARSFSTLVVWLGGFAAVMITSSIFWYSINLRPLGFCFLISYFLESFSFIFLDSEVCKHHGCSVDTGGYLGIAASAFWMLSSVASSRMDAYKFQQAARKKRRHLRMLRRKARMEHMKKASNITEITNISLTDSDSWENSSSDNASSDDSSGSGNSSNDDTAEVFNRTLVSSFATSTDAVETTFVSFDDHHDDDDDDDDIEQGEQQQQQQDPPATNEIRQKEPPMIMSRTMMDHQDQRSNKSKRRVQWMVKDDMNLKSPKTIKCRKEQQDAIQAAVPKSPLAGSARTVELFRAKLVRHQTT